MFRSLTIAASVALMLAGGSQLAHAEQTTLTVGMGAADAGRLDPHLSAAVVDKALMNWMFNGLVRIKPGKASPEFIEPDLAESWITNEDATEWTFKLRQGVQFHHGYGELTADDVVFSINRAANADTSSFAGDFASIESVEAVDPYTIKVTLKNPVPSLLGLLSNYHGGNIISQKAAEELGDGFLRKPIGTGPFQFAEYKAQQFTRLEAHAGYFRGAPKLQEIVYRYIPSDASRDLAFEAGELDMIYGRQDAKWIERIKALPGSVVSVMEPAELSMMYLNVTSPPLDDIRVRQAFAHAVNREQMVALKGADTNRPGQSVVPIGYLGFSSDVDLPNYDPEISKQLLADAGYPDGVTIKTIHTTLPVMLSIMEGVQAQLKKANINLEITPVEHATFHSQIRDDLSQVVHYQAARFPVADVYLTNFFHSNSIVKTPGAITNFSHCSVADAEIEAARSETDLEKQKELWKIAQQKIVKELCGVPVIETLQLWAYKDSLDLGYELTGSLNLGPAITEETHFND